MTSPYQPAEPPQPIPPVVPVAPETPAAVVPPVVGLRPGLMVLPPSRNQAILRVAFGALLIVLGIACQVAGAGFPSNAPVEMAMNFGITLVLVGGGIALLALALRARASNSSVTRPEGVSILSIIAVALMALTVVAWAATAGNWVNLITGVERMRYDGLVGGLFFAGIPWVLGIVFGVTALRHPARISRILSSVAVGLGLLLTIPAVAAAAVYSAGITD